MAAVLKKEDSFDEKAAKAGILPSHGIELDIPAPADGVRPPNIRHMSSPAYESPLRHHRRKHSSVRQVKETLHAHSEYSNSEDDGGAIHRINQYNIKQEIGRGSYGAVHLAVDQHGNEFAVKEFSKSRLRKRAQSNILRRPHAARRTGHLGASMGFGLPMHRNPASDVHGQEEDGNPLYLIKEEIAIMKKLNHDNLVSLIEVLDDPTEDSLYMVLEMCKKGVIMKVGMDEKADPYDDESCRCWFRDLILGIEYLHAQGVVHRDIKPDNLLLTDDDVLKISDFGVSEMFEKESEMKTAKSAGSPAFLPPELCVAKHGDISGRAADIWSMGVTLYCLRFGQIPFESAGVLQLYESIKNNQVDLVLDCPNDFKDLIYRLLEKDPTKRIIMPELRKHPWVTKNGTDPLLSEEENTADLVEPPTEAEKNNAITGNLSNILVLMKAVKRFKNSIAHKRPPHIDRILEGDSKIFQPPMSMLGKSGKSPPIHKSRSFDSNDRKPIERTLVSEGIHRDINVDSFETKLPCEKKDSAISSDHTGPHGPSKQEDTILRATTTHPSDHQPHPPIPMPKDTHPGKGHAHNPLDSHLFLAIGPSGDSTPPDPPAVSESPGAVDINIYETAYKNEVERIREKQGKEATLYLTRRVEGKKGWAEVGGLVKGNRDSDGSEKGGWGKILEMARAKESEKEEGKGEEERKGDEEDRKEEMEKIEGNRNNGSEGDGKTGAKEKPDETMKDV